MIITLLAEPRSGSTNFANWFYNNKNFTVLFIPSDKMSKWYQNGVEPENYKFNTKHLMVKEDYYNDKDYSSLLKISDKVICLYRENEDEQIESWINAVKTNNWHQPWRVGSLKYDESDKHFFKNLKKGFKEKFIDNDDYFSISYEGLYFGNDIEKVKEYIDIDGFGKFPIGGRYRITENKLF